MKHYFLSLTGGLLAALMGNCAAMAADAVPGAFTADKPALAAFKGRTVVAWAGAADTSTYPVWYSSYDGSWTSASQIPNTLTTSAPALGVAAQRLYLATTPPAADDKIQIYVWDGKQFAAGGADLCSGETCAHTRAAPSLAGDGATLYAAWSTPTGTIRYASMINGVWNIAALPVPDASISPTTGPTLALFQHRLYAAWVEPSGKTVSVAVATLPLTSSSWTAQHKIAANTHVAPALGVHTLPKLPDPTKPNALFVSWTTPEATLGFARWDNSKAEWISADSPIPLSSEPLTRLPAALSGFTAVAPNQECYYTNSLAYTGEEEPHHRIHLRQVKQGCP
jgi:hypothetical protein